MSNSSLANLYSRSSKIGQLGSESRPHAGFRGENPQQQYNLNLVLVCARGNEEMMKEVRVMLD